VSQFEQWENVKFCQKLGKTNSKMFQMIKQPYGKEALDPSSVFKWQKHFAQGGDSLEDNEDSGQPRMVRTELKTQEVTKLVHATCSQMVYEFESAAEISHRTCHRNLFDNLNMSRVAQHSVPHFLTQVQCDNRMSCDLISSSQPDYNRKQNMPFSV
jgi:hypothetical protein